MGKGFIRDGSLCWVRAEQDGDRALEDVGDLLELLALVSNDALGLF